MASYSQNSPHGSSHYAPGISSRQSTPSPPLLRESSASVSSQPLSFSISRILGLEDSVTQDQSHSRIPAYGTTDMSRQSSDNSPNIDSDNPSTDVDSGRESDAGRSTPSSPERPRKKKQRTTFSPIEVWELEKVFLKRPYLMPEDEDELVQKLGLTTRNVRFWFQNRRAKLRRQENIAASFQQTSLPNQFYQFQPASHREIQFGSTRAAYPALTRFQRSPLYPNRAEYSPRNQLPYMPEHAPCPCCRIKSNRFPAADVKSPPHREYLEYLPNRFEDLSAFKPTFPKDQPNRQRHIPMADDHRRSRDYQPREYESRDYQSRWVIGIREDEDKD